MSKCVSHEVYTEVCCEVLYGNTINAGQYAHGRLTPPYLTPYFKTLPVDSRNHIMNTGLAFD